MRHTGLKHDGAQVHATIRCNSRRVRRHRRRLQLAVAQPAGRLVVAGGRWQFIDARWLAASLWASPWARTRGARRQWPQELQRVLVEAVAAHDFTAAHEALSAMVQRQPLLGSRSVGPATMLRLCPSGSLALCEMLTAVSGNTSIHHALFQIPTSLATSNYIAQISNGLSTPSHDGDWVTLRIFASPDQPTLTHTGVSDCASGSRSGSRSSATGMPHSLTNLTGNRLLTETRDRAIFSLGAHTQSGLNLKWGTLV